MNQNPLITLNQFIADEQSKFPKVNGNLSNIFRNLQLAAKMINRDVRKAGLVDIRFSEAAPYWCVVGSKASATDPLGT